MMSALRRYRSCLFPLRFRWDCKGRNLFGISKINVEKKTQQEIVSYLDNKCREIEKIILGKQKQIENMEKYKKSLIYEYVTGKKRVKGAEELYG